MRLKVPTHMGRGKIYVRNILSYFLYAQNFRN